MRVFLIDDDIDLLEVLKDTLIALCNVENVITATSLKSAQSQLSEIHKCDLAILDVNLGFNEPSGVRVAEWLRKSDYKGRIVFLTGHAMSDPEVIQATKIPDTSVMAKPIGLNQLIGFVKGSGPR